MKKILLTGLLLASSFVNSSANDVIKVSTGEWPPYTTQINNTTGVLQKIVNEAFKEEGIDVTYDFLSWKKAYKMAKDVSYDGTMPLFKTADREKDFLYSKNVIARTKTVFFHLKSLNFQWNEYSDLKQYKIGETIGFKTAKILKNAGVDVEMASSEKENFDKLLAGKIDATSASYLVGYGIINRNYTTQDIDKFTTHGKKVYPATGVYFLVSKKHPRAQELVDKFDSGLKKLLKSGRYIKLIKEAIKKK